MFIMVFVVEIIQISVMVSIVFVSRGFCDVICHKYDRIAAILWDIATVYTGRKSRAVLYSQSAPAMDETCS